MTQDETKPAAEDEAAADSTLEETPTLNRAERRAQARGKKGGASGNSALGGANRGGGSNQRTSLGNVKANIPRTGHK